MESRFDNFVCALSAVSQYYCSTHGMHLIQTVVIALLVMSVGCSSENASRRHSQTLATTEEHPILKALSTRDRNAVHIALWTVEQDGISISQKIRFDLPYSEVRPKIRAVHDYLQTFPEEKLGALDQSLSYHWTIYSPIWISHDWP